MKWPRKFGVLRIQQENRWIRYPGRQQWTRPGIHHYSNPAPATVNVTRTRRRTR